MLSNTLMAKTGTHESGIDPDSVDSHSLRIIELVILRLRLWLVCAVTNLTKALHFGNPDLLSAGLERRRGARCNEQIIQRTCICFVDTGQGAAAVTGRWRVSGLRLCCALPPSLS